MFSKINILNKYKGKIRERAITKAKAKIALAGKGIKDYNEDQLEIIVKEEEDKIYDSLKNSAFGSILLFLGISSI